MTQIPVLPFERSGHDRVVAGVCGGIASKLGVDATLVRLVFALLAIAGGAGILLYFALWVYDDGRRLWHGSRQTFCPSSPVIAELSLRLAEQVATRYRDHPALAMWHVGNELGNHNVHCFCDVSAAARIAARIAAGFSLRGLSSVTITASAFSVAIAPMIGRLP